MINLGWHFLLLVGDFIELVEVFPLDPRLLLNLAHLFVHDHIPWPFRGILLIEHFELFHVGNFEIFGF